MTDIRYVIFAGTLCVSLIVSVLLTGLTRRLALRWKFLDHPGERKIHDSPIPVMGGYAICATFYIVLLGALFLLARTLGSGWLDYTLAADLGPNAVGKMSGVLVGAFLIFLLGAVDDLKVLKPEVKLLGQIVAAAVLVACGMRIEVFVLTNFWISALVTVLWVVMLCNSLNFLDNMDGLAGGVSVIAAFSFFLAVQPPGQYIVRLLLLVFAGAVAGFLYHNLKPARIFMGDAGSMFCGFILAAVAIMGTFHVEATRSPVSVAAPLLALSVPFFDTMSVVYIRWRSGQSIMKGDKRHFSHRLVDLGRFPISGSLRPAMPISR